MEKALVEQIRHGHASIADLSSVPLSEIIAIKSDPGVPQSRFYAEKAYGVDSAKRQVLGVPHSTEHVDRMGDIIRVKGWQLDNYKKNPVLLFGHNSYGASIKDLLPVAKSLKTRRGQSSSGMKSLLIDEEYHEAEVNPESELVWRMVEAGALPGRSVGFMPIEVNRPENDEEREKLGLGEYGLEFRSQELLESSIVPVPANAAALQGKCKQIARTVAHKAVEDGVVTWSDVQRLASILPLTEQDAQKIERESRRSHVAFPQGTIPSSDGEIIVPRSTSNELAVQLDPNTPLTHASGYIETTGTGNLSSWSPGTYRQIDGEWFIVKDGVPPTATPIEMRTYDSVKEEELQARILELEADNEQLRGQIADLVRAIGVLSVTAEERAERVGTEEDAEHRSIAVSPALYEEAFEIVGRRREQRELANAVKIRLRTALHGGKQAAEE